MSSPFIFGPTGPINLNAPTSGAVQSDASGNYTSGVVSIANGGTNNGSLAVTAGGIVYTDGSKLINAGAGSSGQILKSNGSSAPTWATNTASPVWTIVATKTTTYSANAGEFIPVDGTSGGFTVTLPTAVGISGQLIEIKRTDSTLANTITIATTSSQTIDGFSTRHLMTQYEWIIVVSDGANWYIQNRGYPATPTQFTMSASNLGTLSNNTNCYWWRQGSAMVIKYYCTVGTPAAALASINLPGGTLSSVGTAMTLMGSGATDNSNSFPLTVLGVSGDSFFGLSLIGSTVTAANALAKRNANSPLSTGDTLMLNVTAPMTNWE